MSTLHLIISLLILSEYAAFFVFIFFAAFNISSIVISVSSRFFAFSLFQIFNDFFMFFIRYLVFAMLLFKICIPFAIFRLYRSQDRLLNF
jgi:hypothetical protein